jgi:two-component system OmpR family response regulator
MSSVTVLPSIVFIAAPLRAAEAANSIACVALAVTFFADGDLFLGSDGCYEHDLYVLGGEMPLQDGIALSRLIRRRTSAGLLAWRTRAPAASWLDAGADLWLPRPASLEDLFAGIRAIRRRIRPAATSPPVGAAAWRLDRGGKRLHTPLGVAIPLGDSDVEAFGAFARAGGAIVPYATLGALLGYEAAGADNLLHAAMYRLRRRIERATEESLPLSSQAGDGYLFRGAIVER